MQHEHLINNQKEIYNYKKRLRTATMIYIVGMILACFFAIIYSFYIAVIYIFAAMLYADFNQHKLSQPKISALQEYRKPILVLRSFSDDTLKIYFDPTLGSAPYDRDSNWLGNTSDSWWKSKGAHWYWSLSSSSRVFNQLKSGQLLNNLESAFWDYGPVVTFLSTNNRTKEKLDERIHLIQPNDNWFEKVKLLADNSTLIIIIPSNTEGVIQEFNMIREGNMLEKTIVFIPPVPNVKIYDKKIKIDIQQFNLDQYMIIKTGLHAFGFNLPDYSTKGIAYIPNKDFSVKKVVQFTDVKRLLNQSTQEHLDQPLSFYL